MQEANFAYEPPPPLCHHDNVPYTSEQETFTVADFTASHQILHHEDDGESSSLPPVSSLISFAPYYPDFAF